MTTESENLQKRYIYWERYYTFLKVLKTKISVCPEIIISIGKGGSIPGVILAEMYNINNINFGIKSYNNFSRENIIEYQPIPDFTGISSMKVLLVDDLVDSGSTFKYAINKLKANGVEHLNTAVVFKKTSSIIEPDYFVEEIPDSQWVVHPWEFA